MSEKKKKNLRHYNNKKERKKEWKKRKLEFLKILKSSGAVKTKII